MKTKAKQRTEAHPVVVLMQEALDRLGLTATDAAERYLLYGAGRPLRVARLRELEIAVAGCRQ